MSLLAQYSHTPILVEEIINLLPIKPNSIIVDCTVGEGGHSEIFISHLVGGTLIALDQDKDILKIAEKRLFNKAEAINQNTQIIIKESNFSDISNILDDLNIDKVDLLFYDLGISMYHFKESQRGFSFSGDQFLDMRLDKANSLTAYDVINSFPENEIREIVFHYGEESWAKVIARNIVQARENKKIETANDLQKIVSNSMPNKKGDRKINPATKTFQALRIFINRELYHIETAMIEGIRRLSFGGRIGVLTFHSLEDRIVKQVFKYFSLSCICPKIYPVCQCDSRSTLKILTKKPITPSKKEISNNRSARSAKLRVVEKIYEASNKTWEISKTSFQTPKKLFNNSYYLNHTAG